jgi:hypothetical protein
MAHYSMAFNHVLFFGRDYDEVLAMVALTEADLVGEKILDCPSGPDAFVAGAAQRGFDVIGCDPLYNKPREEIVRQGKADIALWAAEATKYADELGGLDVAAFYEKKLRALDQFAADFEAGCAAGRYVAASLPRLPFADKSFDLVTSANLLFTYSSNATGGIADSDTLDLDFHRESVHELIRVSRGEVRLYPIMSHGAKPKLHPYVAQIIGQLAADGVTMSFEESAYSQGKFTGHLVLVLDCAEK